MSRGPGRAERAVLEHLTRVAKRDPEWDERLDVIARQTGHHPESVRRVIKSLARKGLVVLGHDNGWRCYDDSGWLRMYDTSCPTARLSADNLSALTAGQP